MPFGFNFGYGFGYIGDVASIPSVLTWISLNGDITTLPNGTRELVNSVGDNVESTTGQGVYLTAGDHTIPTQISGDITTFAYTYEGTVYYNTLGNVTDYVINPTTLQGTGVYSNFIFTTQIGGFSTAEKSWLELQPETFLYMDTDVITSDVLASTADIVGWIPTTDDGSTVWDMVSKTTPEILGDESVVEGDFEGTELDFTNAWSGLPSATWIWNGDGTVTHTSDNRPSQTVVYAGGLNKTYRLNIDWASAGTSQIRITVDGASLPVSSVAPFIYDFDNGNDANKYFAFGRYSGDNVIFESVSIREIISLGGTARPQYDIVDYYPSVRSEAHSLNYGLQTIKFGIDSNGMPISKTNNMSFTSAESKQIILKATYANIYLNGYLETVSIPNYNAVDSEHILLSDSDDYVTAIESGTYKRIFLNVGDYPDLVTITNSGTAINRNSISLYNGNDTHPSTLDFDTQTARIRIDFDGASYWDISRLSNALEFADKPNFQVFGGSSYNVFDRVYMKEHGHAIRIHDTGSDYNTVQSGYFESMNMDAIVGDRVTLGIDSRNLDNITIEGTKFINNDIFNTNDGIQTILSSGSINCSFPNTIIDGNRISTTRFTNGTYGLTYEKVITGWDEDMSFDQPTKTISWTKETLTDITIGSTIHVEGSGVDGSVGANDGTYTVASFTDKSLTIVEDALTTQGSGGLVWASITNNTLNADKGKFFTSGEFMIGENAIDLKVGSNDPIEPMIITNNVMEGWVQSDVTHIGGYSRGLGNALVAHYKANNVVLEDNIWRDCAVGIGISGKRSGDTYTVKDWSVRRNIFIRLGAGNPYEKGYLSLNQFTEADGLKLESNIFIDTIEVVGASRQCIGYYSPQGTTNTIGSNCFINSSGLPDIAYLTNVTVGVNYYYNGRDLESGDAANRIEYATAEEANLSNMTFFTEVIKEQTTAVEEVLTTASSPHVAVCNPQGVEAPLGGGALSTPYTLKEIADGVHYIRTDDGTTQVLYVDKIPQSSTPISGDLYMDKVSQVSGVTVENVTLFEVFNGAMTQSEVDAEYDADMA